jgi:hypothetical protein
MRLKGQFPCGWQRPRDGTHPCHADLPLDIAQQGFMMTGIAISDLTATDEIS